MMTEAEAPLRIVSYSRTTLAGVPAVLARCVSARTPHRCRCVWAKNVSGTKIEFRGDIEWSRDPAPARQELEAADLVIVHNGFVDPEHAPILDRKPVITMAHNYDWNVDTAFVRQGMPGVVVGQYQALLPAFQGWRAVPNPVPLWEPELQPGPKAGPVGLCFTPSGFHERFTEDHAMYWHSKGYSETMAAMRLIQRKHGARIEAVEGSLVTHDESLAMKRRSHVVIDECVTGSYHRNSLEGLAAGCVVVNGVGLLPGVPEILRYCARFAHAVPFEASDLTNVGTVLEGLVEAGRERLEEAGRRNRAWMERYWDFEEQWSYFWRPVVRMALEAARS